MLTPLEHRILDFIRAFIVRHGYGPTLTEIGAAAGIGSKGTVHRYVQSLKDKGRLAHAERGWRGIRLADGLSAQSGILPLVGRIAAGRPIEAIPGHDTLNLNEFLGEDRYALEVRGESMIGIGILDGDLVIIKQQDTADNGDIVVALIDEEEATLKRYQSLGDGRIQLSAENPEIRPLIYAARRIRIQGVLVGQLRRYG